MEQISGSTSRTKGLARLREEVLAEAEFVWFFATVINRIAYASLEDPKIDVSNPISPSEPSARLDRRTGAAAGGAEYPLPGAAVVGRQEGDARVVGA